MKKTILLISALILLTLPLASCEIIKDGDSVRIDPNQAAKVEGAAEAGVGILQALGVLWPAAGAGAVGLAGALRAWRNAKDKLTKKQTEADAYYNATEALVNAIEDFRLANPEKWAKLKIQLKKSVGPGVENIIRAIRGIPLKQ